MVRIELTTLVSLEYIYDEYKDHALPTVLHKQSESIFLNSLFIYFFKDDLVDKLVSDPRIENPASKALVDIPRTFTQRSNLFPLSNARALSLLAFRR